MEFYVYAFSHNTVIRHAISHDIEYICEYNEIT